jgi:hypothetical protein
MDLRIISPPSSKRFYEAAEKRLTGTTVHAPARRILSIRHARELGTVEPVTVSQHPPTLPGEGAAGSTSGPLAALFVGRDQRWDEPA